MTTHPTKISAKALNTISALLMIVMLACQFIPYWHFGEGESLSVQGYVWFPTKHPALSEELQPLVDKYPCNQATLACLPVMLLCLLGVWLCLRKADKPKMGMLPFLTGLAGLALYLSSPVMQAGTLYWLHVAVLALLMGLGIFTMTRKQK